MSARLAARVTVLVAERSAALERIRGSCLCGTVQFSVAPPYAWFANCHCSMCRKHHGALFGSGLGVHVDRFVWHTGVDAIAHFRATNAFERPFCRRCGSTVPGSSHRDDVMLVPSGTLERLNAAPRTHIFVGSKSPFTTIADGLPRYDTYPPSVGLQAVRPARAAASEERACIGSCLCGSVAYRVEGAVEHVASCHCALCRRSTGSPFATTASVRLTRFRWLRGAALLRIFRGPEGHSYTAVFCAHCGGLLPAPERSSDRVSIPVGALDTDTA